MQQHKYLLLAMHLAFGLLKSTNNINVNLYDNKWIMAFACDTTGTLFARGAGRGLLWCCLKEMKYLPGSVISTAN